MEGGSRVGGSANRGKSAGSQWRDLRAWGGRGSGRMGCAALARPSPAPSAPRLLRGAGPCRRGAILRQRRCAGGVGTGGVGEARAADGAGAAEAGGRAPTGDGGAPAAAGLGTRRPTADGRTEEGGFGVAAVLRELTAAAAGPAAGFAAAVSCGLFDPDAGG